jgi:Holliday junction resolvasome RuvABC endonuclease subunit
MNELRLVGLDPALNNLGVAYAHYNLETMALRITNLSLVHTENQAGKQVRKNSDDLRRARELVGHLMLAQNVCDLFIAEIPTGSLSARGTMSNGIMIGALASLRKPIIEVLPADVKKATVGVKTATKEEMIEWATANYPDAGWITMKRKGEAVLVKKNEHLADAVAILHAGVRSQQFRETLAIMQRVLAA